MWRVTNLALPCKDGGGRKELSGKQSDTSVQRTNQVTQLDTWQPRPAGVDVNQHVARLQVLERTTWGIEENLNQDTARLAQETYAMRHVQGVQLCQSPQKVHHDGEVRSGRLTASFAAVAHACAVTGEQALQADPKLVHHKVQNH